MNKLQLKSTENISSSLEEAKLDIIEYAKQNDCYDREVILGRYKSGEEAYDWVDKEFTLVGNFCGTELQKSAWPNTDEQGNTYDLYTVGNDVSKQSASPNNWKDQIFVTFNGKQLPRYIFVKVYINDKNNGIIQNVGDISFLANNQTFGGSTNKNIDTTRDFYQISTMDKNTVELEISYKDTTISSGSYRKFNIFILVPNDIREWEKVDNPNQDVKTVNGFVYKNGNVTTVTFPDDFQPEINIAKDYVAPTYNEAFTSATANEITKEDTVSQGVNKVDNKLASLVSKVITDEGRLDVVESALTANGGSISSLSGIVSSHTSSISALTGDVQSLKSLSATVTSHTNTINTLTGDVQSLKAITHKTINGQTITGSGNIDIITTIPSNYVAPTYSEEFTASTPNTIVSDETVQSAIQKLDNKTSEVVKEVVKNELTTAKAVEALSDGTGLYTEDGIIKYVQDPHASIIKYAENLAEADTLLEEAILNLATDVANVKGAKFKTINGESIIWEEGNENIDIVTTIPSDYVAPEYNENFTASTPNTIVSGETVQSAIQKLDNKSNEIVNEVVKNELTTASAIEALATSSGLYTADGIIKYVVDNQAPIIKYADNLAEADSLLEDAIVGLLTRINALETQVANLVTDLASAQASLAQIEEDIEAGGGLTQDDGEY